MRLAWPGTSANVGGIKHGGSDCAGEIISSGSSEGFNIESPSDTCGFDQITDQVSVSVENLNLGPLQDNGGPTMTHALVPVSVAIDVIPEETCELDTDQRGITRPLGPGCDVGAFELGPPERAHAARGSF